MTDTPTPDTPEPVEAASEPVEPVQEAPAEPEVFPAEYVRKLRAEAAEARVKAKIADTANEHLLAAYAVADGRLRDVEALPLSADLLGDDGLVARDKVAEAIGSLVTAKPYLLAPKPAPLPMGVQPEAPAELGWVDVLRGAR